MYMYVCGVGLCLSAGDTLHCEVVSAQPCEVGIQPNDTDTQTQNQAGKDKTKNKTKNKLQEKFEMLKHSVVVKWNGLGREGRYINIDMYNIDSMDVYR